MPNKRSTKREGRAVIKRRRGQQPPRRARGDGARVLAAVADRRAAGCAERRAARCAPRRAGGRGGRGAPSPFEWYPSMASLTACKYAQAAAVDAAAVRSPASATRRRDGPERDRRRRAPGSKAAASLAADRWARSSASILRTPKGRGAARRERPSRRGARPSTRRARPRRATAALRKTSTS